MEIEDIEIIVKFVYPVISGAFVIIMALFVYIWKTNLNSNKEVQVRQDDILEELVGAVQELKEMNAASKERFKNNERRISRNEKDIEKIA